MSREMKDSGLEWIGEIPEDWKLIRLCNMTKSIFLGKKIPQIDRLIIKKEKFVDELKSYKRSLIYEYVTGKKEVPES